MREPLLRAGHVGAVRVERERRIDAAEHEVAAHPGGQVDDRVDVGGAHALDHLAVELDVARAAARRGIAHVDVDDRGAGAGRLDRRVGDLGRA